MSQAAATERTIDIRVRERRATAEAHVRAAVGHAKLALEADDPARALGLLELACDAMTAAAEHARTAATMALQAGRGGGRS